MTTATMERPTDVQYPPENQYECMVTIRTSRAMRARILAAARKSGQSMNSLCLEVIARRVAEIEQSPEIAAAE